MIRAGLRIDVDTLRGACLGVPNLLDLLARRQLHASFFFSVGPDNMGRHLWRLMRPAFLFKMCRTGAVKLYGWDILLRGLLWPGPVIGRRCPEQIQRAAAAGHEVGLHAWDHHRWQTCLSRLDQPAIAAEVQKGYDLLSALLGRAPDCFAAPAWRVTADALRALEAFPFRYESDCRGHSLFHPLVEGRRLKHVQIPTTLPTYDELMGRRCTRETYNDFLLGMIQPDRLNVLTIHAEVEGISCLDLFDDFLDKARKRDVRFEPLGSLVSQGEIMAAAEIQQGFMDGREGWLACQAGGL